ncbi:MAG: TetR/AcrR family transcriptional regulator [Gordonibacter sp.]|uniref:TetR/AcrR family transcriptional regulator n=1 Tax=Gordonibacter sp. TaxID=1968902 RepID=UPI002FCC8C1D
MKKQSQVTELTKAKIREAFWQLYEQKPIDKISIKEITDAAGYNRGTFYLYYKDVYDLFSQIEEELLGMIRTLIDEKLLQGDEPDFKRHMGFILQLTRAYEPYVSVLLGDRGDPAFNRKLKAIIAPLVESLLIPADGCTDEERALLREFYLSGLLAAVSQWITNPEGMPIDHLIQLILDTVLPNKDKIADTSRPFTP